MIDLFEEMEADQEAASKVENVSTKGLQGVAEVARNIRNKTTEVEDLKKTLKESEAALRQLTDQDLPDLLHEIGINEFTLDDGSKVELRPIYSARIPVEHREAAHAWLREKGFDDIIKNLVSIPFGRGEDGKAGDFISLARMKGFEVMQKQEVHSGTLKAFVKERIEKGEDVPADLFGVFTGERATIKKGK